MKMRIGENYMNLIDINEIKKQSDMLRQDNVALENLFHKEMKSSYFNKPIDELPHISEYNFATPKELKTEVSKFWERIGKEYMEVFLLCVVASAFKNRPEKIDKKDMISPFVYEF